MGRSRADHPSISADDRGYQILSAPCCRRAVRPHARWRVRNLSSTPRAGSPMRKPTWASLKQASVSFPPAVAPKKCLLRSFDAAAALAPPDPKDPPSRFAQSAEVATALKRSLETIAMAKASTSAVEARALGLLAPSDRITMNRERLLLDAKEQAIALAQSGYSAPQPRVIPAPGLAALATMETGIYLMGEAGYAPRTIRKSHAGAHTFSPPAASLPAPSSPSNIFSTSSAKPSSPSAASASRRNASPSPSKQGSHSVIRGGPEVALPPHTA